MSENIKIDPKVKDVLLLLGAGTFLAASTISPESPPKTEEEIPGIYKIKVKRKLRVKETRVKFFDIKL